MFRPVQQHLLQSRGEQENENSDIVEASWFFESHQSKMSFVDHGLHALLPAFQTSFSLNGVTPRIWEDSKGYNVQDRDGPLFRLAATEQWQKLKPLVQLSSRC